MANDQVTGIDLSIIQETKTDGNDVKEQEKITKKDCNKQYY